MTATPTRPTPEQLQRVIDVIAAGLDLDDAIESVWADIPEPKPAPKPTVMVTEFPDGIIVGWDRCTVLNGGCGEHVAKCKCKGGPKEARVFEEWRTGTKSMPSYGATQVGTAPTSSKPRKATTPVAGLGDAPGRPSSDDLPPNGQVNCVIHGDFVDQAEADKNDDGTWTCFICQESGAQRGVQVDG